MNIFVVQSLRMLQNNPIIKDIIHIISSIRSCNSNIRLDQFYNEWLQIGNELRRRTNEDEDYEVVIILSSMCNDCDFFPTGQYTPTNVAELTPMSTPDSKIDVSPYECV